jgi:rRNA biogenesis protein RRP5
MEIDDEYEEENSIEENHKKKTLKNKHKQKSHLKEELSIREKETEKKIGEYNSVEDYEKLILSDPQNSLYWIQYSAFILDNLGMESCRKIMDRAVHTIDITNLKNKMNLWIAYMNLENTYGTQENFKSVVERALIVNEKREIYKHLINIYKISSKFDLAFEVFKICIKEYFEDINVWKSFIEFLFEVKAEKIKKENNVNFLKKIENVFDCKEGLNRCYQTLGKSRHFEVI